MFKRILLFLIAILEEISWMLVVTLFVDFGFLHTDFHQDIGPFIIQLAIGVIGIGLLNIAVSKLRDYSDSNWALLLFICSPIRLPLIIISWPIKLILKLTVDELDLDLSGESDTDEEVLGNFTNILFGFIIEMDNDGKKKNLLTLLFYQVPMTAFQLLSLVWIYNIFNDEVLMESNIIIYILKFTFAIFCLFIATYFIVLGRCEEVNFQYFDQNLLIKDKETKVVTKDYLDDDTVEKYTRNYDNNIPLDRTLDNQGFKRVRGGWTYVFSFPFVCRLILAPINAVLLLITLIIAIISSNEKKILCWYGEVDYSRCKSIFINKILHFLFGFIVVGDEVYHERKYKEKSEVGYGWFFLGPLLCNIIGFIIIAVLWNKDENNRIKAKRMLIGMVVSFILQIILVILIISQGYIEL